MSSRFKVVVVGLALALLVPGCKKDGDAKEEPAAEPAADEGAQPEGEAQDAPKETVADSTFLPGFMKPYDKCRELLAADQAKGVADCARDISAAAKEAGPAAPEAARPALAELETAAQKLSEMPMDDVDAVRAAFGEVSKPVVAVLEAMPEAAASYHVFECPMAKGYKRWVQADTELKNPYMGSEMLACGSEVSLAEGTAE